MLLAIYQYLLLIFFVSIVPEPLFLSARFRQPEKKKKPAKPRLLIFRNVIDGEIGHTTSKAFVSILAFSCDRVIENIARPRPKASTTTVLNYLSLFAVGGRLICNGCRTVYATLSTKRWKYVRFLINRWLSPAVPCWRRWDLLVRNWRVATCSFVGKCPEGTDGHAFFHHPPACWSSLRLSIHPQSWWMAYSLLLITCYELVVHLRQHYTPSFTLFFFHFPSSF